MPLLLHISHFHMVRTSKNHGIVINIPISRIINVICDSNKRLVLGTIGTGIRPIMNMVPLSQSMFINHSAVPTLSGRRVLFTLEKPATFTFPAAVLPLQANYPE